MRIIATILLAAFLAACTHTVVIKESEDIRTERRSKDAFNELDNQKW